MWRLGLLLLLMYLLIDVGAVELAVPGGQSDVATRASSGEATRVNVRQVTLSPPAMETACPNETCWIQGQPDLYGFGTRVGIYFTWSASLIANNFLPEEYDGALDNNTVFLFALTIVVIFYASKQQLRALDVLILLQLCLGFIFTVMTVWGYRSSFYWRELSNAVKQFGGTGTWVRLFILSAISAYSLWFWSSGYRSASLEYCRWRQICYHDVRVFFFGVTFDLSSQTLRALYVTISSILCFHYLCLLLALAVGILRRRRPPPEGNKPPGPWRSLDNQRVYYTRFTRRQFKVLNFILLLANIIALALSVAGVEMTIRRNNISDVGIQNIASYGQLLPLSIGGLQMLKTGIDLVKTYRKAFRKTTKKHPAPDKLPQPFTQISNPKVRPYDGLFYRVLALWLPWLLYFREPAGETPSEKEAAGENRKRQQHKEEKKAQKRHEWLQEYQHSIAGGPAGPIAPARPQGG